jgi:hypothetical protein
MLHRRGMGHPHWDLSQFWLTVLWVKDREVAEALYGHATRARFKGFRC